MAQDNRDIRKICEEVLREKDRQRFEGLLEELLRALEEREGIRLNGQA
jgi:hypothetical protein